MAKNRVFGRPMPDASVPRNAFDMSKVTRLNFSFGQLIPVYAHQFIAGSRFQIDMNSFFRTAKVNTAAFPQLNIETEFFCVPLRYLWSFWDTFKLGVNDINSTALGNPDTMTLAAPTTVPSVDLFKSLWVLATSNDSVYDSCGYKFTDGMKRLLDMLGYGRLTSVIDSDVLQANAQKVSLFKIAAYQKVYFDHFRNTAYEANDPYAYNLDYLTLSPERLQTAANIRKFFTLRYVNYRKDYMRSIYPGLTFITQGTNYLTQGSASTNLTSLPSWIQGLMSGVATGNDMYRWQHTDGSNITSDSVSTPNVGTYSRSLTDASAEKYMIHDHLIPDSIFNVQSIRAAFALDKLNRSAAYAPQHVKDQYEARYGIKFPSASSFESQRIANFSTELTIGEVTSTANTLNGNVGDALGDIGGKGIGARQRSGMVSFDVKEDSIIIGVCYAVPRASYDSHRIENWNMKLSRNDFFIPEFMNLGLKPVYAKEFGFNAYNSNTGQYDSLATSAGQNTVIGYQLPYMEYKADVDENHGLFADRESDLGQFVVHSNYGSNGTTDGKPYYFFKCTPGDLNSIFVNEADGSEATDQIFGQIDFHIAVNQNMSVHGMPSL